MDTRKMTHGRVRKSPPVRLLSKPEWTKMLDEWHYLGSKCAGGAIAYGHDEGCCVFAYPRSNGVTKWFPGLKVTELARMVGKPNHDWAMSSLMAASLCEMRKRGYDVVITYADPLAGHDGAVYRASNWTPLGLSSTEPVWHLDGVRVSRKNMYNIHGHCKPTVFREMFGDRFQVSKGVPKPRFLMGLTRDGRRAVQERASG